VLALAWAVPKLPHPLPCRAAAYMSRNGTAIFTALCLPPDRHDEIWSIQRKLDFPGTVYGDGRDVSVRELMYHQSRYYGARSKDTVVVQ
jgi:hypothetical protein